MSKLRKCSLPLSTISVETLNSQEPLLTLLATRERERERVRRKIETKKRGRERERERKKE